VGGNEFLPTLHAERATRQSPQAAEGLASFKDKRAAKWTPGNS